MTKPLALTFAFALATPACGEAVDLGGTASETSDSAPVVESDEEGVVADLHEQPDLLVSDGDRLYWAGNVWAFENATTVRSCRKADCARSVIAYATAPFVAWLEVAAGEVYFRPFTDLGEAIESSVLSCPTTGCTGDARIVVEGAGAFTLARDSIFFSSSSAEPPGIYQKPRSGGDATLVVAVPARLNRIRVQDDQLVWRSTEGVLQRTSLRGERSIETLFDDPRSASSLSFTSDAEAVYWSTSDLTSKLERCPLVGCPSGPEVVAPLRIPSSLFASDGHLYVNVELESSEVGLVSCSPLDCTNPRFLGFADRGSSSIATDERFVYTFSNHDFQGEPWSLPADTSQTASGVPLSSLRRYEK